jgi:hypothetical protein
MEYSFNDLKNNGTKITEKIFSLSIDAEANHAEKYLNSCIDDFENVTEAQFMKFHNLAYQKIG